MLFSIHSAALRTCLRFAIYDSLFRVHLRSPREIACPLGGKAVISRGKSAVNEFEKTNPIGRAVPGNSKS